MNVDTLQKLRKLFAVLVAAVVAAVLIAMLFVAHVLHQSKLRYYDSAQETSRNLAISLENFLHSHFQEVDLAMRRAGLEFRNQHQQGTFDDARFSAYLRDLKERIPQARAVRGSDRDGRVIYGDDIDLAHPQDLTIREFFQRARTERELVFGVPIKSRISGEWVLPLVYALTLPDGSFGGTAYANMNNSRVNELFSSIKTGPNGTIVLLDDKKRLLQRYPQLPDTPIGTLVKVSPETAAAMNGGKRSTTYTAVSVRDGYERVLSLEKIGAYPIYVLVGLASDDFLAPWHKEVRNASIFLAVLVVLAAALLAGVRVSLNKQYQALVQLLDTDNALQGTLSALTGSEARWRSLTEGLPQMVWTATPDGRIDFMSHHWHEFSGLAVADMLASGDWSSVVHPEDQPQLAAAWQHSLAAGDQFRCDCRLRRHDGVWRVFDNHALPQRNGAGAVVSWVGSSTDRTESRAAHDALLLAKEEALSAGRAKSEFVANMSHEIRSPMNAVLGMLQLLQQTRMDERQRDYAAKAESAARALLGLLNDILDFSKVEAGKLALDPHPFSLDKLWRDLAVILSANIGAKNVEVLFRIDPALPLDLVGDALRLQQVLLNLAGNAIKFTEQGEVLLSAQLTEERATTLTVQFSIRDSGIGISAEHARHIFDGFSQAEASTARRYGGTGLGLAISQRLVRLMGGSLTVESELGQGSVFEFSVTFQRAPARAGEVGAADPAELADPADPAAAKHASKATVALALMPSALAPASRIAADKLLQRLSCLVVDDNPSARMVLSEMVASFGWQVDAVDSGAAALAAVAQRSQSGDGGHPYDVMFVDWRMPALDGWETSRQLRQMAPAIKTPLIVMVTAHDREMLAQRSSELAPVLDGFVVKPVTASILFDAVADARLGRRSLPPAAMPSLRRLAGLRLLLVDDNPANQQVASELLRNDGADVEVANCGQSAIDAVTRGGPLPDLVLMDIQMPDMDGYAATREILARLGAHAPPIVAMTANAMPADRDAALAAGMLDHVGKPFDLAQLIEVILRHAVRSADAAAVPAQPLPVQPLPVPPLQAQPLSAQVQVAVPVRIATTQMAELGLNSVAALKRMGGLTHVYQMTLRSFNDEAASLALQLRHACLQSAALPGDAAARDRVQVSASPDAPRPAHLAAALMALHTLKGLAGTVGADHLSSLAQQAEQSLKADPSGTGWDGVQAILAAMPGILEAVDRLAGQLDSATSTS